MPEMQTRMHTVTGDAWRTNKSWQWATVARNILRLDAVGGLIVVWYQPYGDDQAYPVYEGRSANEARELMRHLLGIPARRELPHYIETVLTSLT